MKTLLVQELSADLEFAEARINSIRTALDHLLAAGQVS
jgi:hypothetical protein